MDKLSPEQLKNKIDQASLLVEIGGRYQHYKGSEYIYLVKGLGITESDDDVAVIYEPEYFSKDALIQFIRPLSVWLEKVEWDGKNVERFKKIEG